MHDAFLNDAKDGPLQVAEYSVTLAHATQGRCYGTGEMRAWLTAAGFIDMTYQDTAAARGVVTARKPREAAPRRGLDCDDHLATAIPASGRTAEATIAADRGGRW